MPFELARSVGDPSKVVLRHGFLASSLYAVLVSQNGSGRVSKCSEILTVL